MQNCNKPLCVVDVYAQVDILDVCRACHVLCRVSCVMCHVSCVMCRVVQGVRSSPMPFQLQGLQWMCQRECREGGEGAAPPVHPLWDELVTPDGPPRPS